MNSAAAARSADNCLEGRGLTLRYGGACVLDAVDLELRAGEILGLIGPNGAGKSSLMRVLAGLQTPASGQLLWLGKALTSLDRQQRARQIGYLPQAAPLHWPLTVRTVVELGRLPWRAGWQRDAGGHAAVDRALLVAELTPLADRLVDTLSGGERMRVMVARLLASESDLLLADEPVAGLDLAHQLQVMHLLRDQARSGRAVIVVLHDLNLAARYCDRLLLLSGGKVLASGPPGEVLEPNRIGRCYGVSLRRLEECGQVTLLPSIEPAQTS